MNQNFFQLRTSRRNRLLQPNGNSLENHYEPECFSNSSSRRDSLFQPNGNALGKKQHEFNRPERAAKINSCKT